MNDIDKTDWEKYFGSAFSKKPQPRNGTTIYNNPPQKKCPWYRHLLPGISLHATVHAIGPTYTSAHVTACDGNEYCKDLKTGTLFEWDDEYCDYFYTEPYQISSIYNGSK